MILALLLAAQDAPTTLARVEALPPDRAADLVIFGEARRPMASMSRMKDPHLSPPGSAYLELLEVPQATRDGCIRTRWEAAFFTDPGSVGPVFHHSFGQRQIALLPAKGGCRAASWTTLQPGTPEAPVFAGLRRLRDITGGKAKVTFTCTTQAEQDFCNRPLPQSISLLTPRVASEQDGEFEFWLGDPGTLLTIVRWREDAADQVIVERKIPNSG